MSGEKIQIIIDSDLEELIPGFLENRRKDVDLLRDALGTGKIDTIQSIGHSLKGVGGGYGFDRLSQLGAELEVKVKSGSTDGLDTVINNIEDYLNRIEISFE